jgi:threonine dehydrogenase-like Zn-dependent dehydrogenase
MPDPAPGAGEALVRVAACGICGSDVHYRHARDRVDKRYPCIIGHEFAGTIAALGPGVTGFDVGQEVACQPVGARCGSCRMCRQGRFNSCRLYADVGFGPDGAHAEFITTPIVGLHRLPATVGAEDAAIAEPLALAHTCVFERSRVSSGEVVVVLGCGPIGLLCATLAAGAGAEVIVTGWTGDEVRLAAARAIGARHVVNAADEDVRELIPSLMGGEGPEVIIDAVGSSDTFAAALELAPPFGRVTKVGWFGKKRELNLDALVRKNLEVRGAYGNLYETWEKCIRLLGAGRVPLHPLITHRLPLNDWEEGYRLAEEREAVKVLLCPNTARH